ncbi:MAG: hypothetical protein LWX11_06360 [Firmicutes bacterium]|nr:hypothetical protein [Bacillota bacterium]
MRPLPRALWTVPVLVLLVGCDAINPARIYQEAARNLRFSLDRVEPSIQLAFPLEDSRLGLRLVMGVDNPTGLHFKALGLAGQLNLDEGARSHGLGQVAFTQGLDLAPNGRSQLPVDVTFTYRQLSQSWAPVRSAIQSGKGTWRLEGQAQLQAMGVPFTVPVKVVRGAGN